MMEILPAQIREPDVAFISNARMPSLKVLEEDPAPEIAPDLAVEVLSRSNTKKEMDRKLADYFRAGVGLVWFIDPRARTAEAYTSPARRKAIGSDGSLDGGKVLPGFSLKLKDLFARLPAK
jgi:Uma2 family endonuclease